MSKQIKFLLVLTILFFGIQISAQTVFIEKGAVWKYLDNGSDQGTAWRELDFNDSSWAAGPAQLGYSEGDESTLLSYGPDPNNKYITTYFRHSFEITDSTNFFNLLIKLLRDDGAVVYLNGTEIVRSNMPAGTITYTTTSTTYVAGSEEDTFYEFFADPAILRLGTNVIAVELHQSSGSSSDISFDFELSASTTLPSLDRKAPYLIYTGKNTEYKILWQLRRTETCTLQWGTNTDYSDGNTSTTEYGTDHQHSYKFTDLTPNTKYYYKVTVDTLEYTGAFYTAPENDVDSVKFLVYGDNRSYPEDHDKVAKQIINLYTSDPEYQGIIINVGDMVSSGDSEEDWDNQFFDPKFENIQELLGSMGLQAARGNHEDSGIIFRKYFPYPLVSDNYWSFNYGPAHFTVIDQYVPYISGSDQYNWLKNDLQRSHQKWKFIILHSPGWSAGGHGNSLTVQSVIQPLCEEYDVKIVFGGHNHYYSRAVVNGITHITTGGGGAPLYAPNASYPNIVKTSMTHHFCKINLTGDNLDFKAIDDSGNEVDAFTISLTGVNDDMDNQLPTEFSLAQNYPNPFNPSTTISYSIPTKSQNVTIKVYDILGKEVATLVNREQKAGNYQVTFNAENLASGVYYYRLISGNFVQSKKMMLIK